MILETKPKIVFIDIRMASIDSRALRARLEDSDRPEIIFTSAFSVVELKALEIAALYYLIKPIGREALLAALDTVRRRWSVLAADQTPSPPLLDKGLELLVEDRGAERSLPVSEVIWLQAERDYVRVHTQERSFLVRQTLQCLGDQLSRQGFTRVHRSVVVNAGKVLRRERRSDGGLRLVLEGGVQVPVGRKFARASNAKTQSRVAGPASGAGAIQLPTRPAPYSFAS
jgi:two-component system LytT family response regulator/two-component system response regulator AlgR